MKMMLWFGFLKDGFRLFASAALVASLMSVQAAPPGAIPVFADDFESGTLNLWTTTVSNPLDPSTTQNAVPVGGQFSAFMNTSIDRMHRNIIADNGGAELDGHILFTCWIYDQGTNSGTVGATRIFNEIRGYSGGTGLPNGGTVASGTLAQLLAVGKFNSVTLPGEVFTATKYQGRVAFHTPQPAGDTGWLNLNGPGSPNRSVGWHRFDIEVMPGGTTVNFYVDGILSRTFNGATAATYDTVILGPGLGSQVGDAWIDGMSVGRVDLPPVINCPSNIIVAATSGAGAVVNYTVTATDATDTNVTIACNPPSGSTFPIGQTPVTCTATDDAGNTARCEFAVTVTPPVIFEGFEVYPKGQAVVQPDQSGRRLPVRNLGSSGEDGVDIALRGVDGLSVVFVPYDYLAETCTASAVEIEVDGAPAALRSELALGPGLTTARVDFSALGSTESEIEIRGANNQLLDRYRIPNGAVIDVEKLFPQCPSNTVVYSYFQGPDLAWYRFCKPTCFPCVGTNCWVERVVCIRAIVELPRAIVLKSMQLCFASQGNTAITIEDLEFMELGNQHHGKPEVLVDGSGPGLRMNINGIGRSGTISSGGVMVKPPNHNPEARRIDVELVPLSLVGAGPAPGGFMLEAIGAVNGLPGQSLGTASLRQLGGPAAAIQMAADFSALGATMVRLDVLNNGQPVGRAMLPMGSFGTLTGDGLIRGCGKLPPRPPCFFVEFNRQMTFTGSDGTTLEGDEFRILAGDATVQVQTLESLCLMAANLDFTILRESIQSAGEVFFPDDVFPPPTATWGSLKQEWDTYGGGGGGSGGGIALRSQKRAFFDPASPLPGPGQTSTIQFSAIVEADVSTDGGQSSRCMDFRGGVMYQITGGPAQGDTRLFEIEILSMSLGSPLGPFRIRESPTKQSLGRLSVRQLSAGGYMMDSFFDVFTEFSVNGGNEWVPGDGAWMMELLGYAVGPFPKPNLPPAGGSYAMQCPPVDFANQMLVRNLVLLNLSEGPPLDQIPPGGTQSAQFQGGCSFEHSRDGGQTWQPEQAECRATFVISHVLDYEGGTRYFDTEMLQLDIQGGTLPASIRLRESPTRRSHGRTCLGQNDSGQSLMGSFFDVFTEITIDDGQSYAPARRPARLTLTHGGNDCLRIVCPSDIRIWTCEDGAVVNYTVTATSQCGSIPVIDCRPPSGSFFPVGTTVVDCRARDAAGNVATCSFKVEVVQDSAPPKIVCPSGPVGQWICTNGTPIHFSVTATDDCDTNVTIVCNPPSGTPLPPGNHVVSCEAIDDCGKRDRCEFVITVQRDTEPPRLLCPEKIEICTCNPNGTNVIYSVVATDDCDTNVTVVCNPPSGSFFPPGTTMVTCTARDDCGNSTDCSFPVTVIVNRVAIICPPDMKVFTCSNTAVVNYDVGAANRCGRACVVADNNSGTVRLPAPCPLGSAQKMMIIDGLPPGTTLESTPVFHSFVCQPGIPAACAADCFVQDDCDPSNGEIVAYESTLELVMEGTGGLAGYRRTFVLPHVLERDGYAARTPGTMVQSFDSQKLRLQGQLPPGDPDFDLLRITAGTDFGLPSPGHTTLTRQPGSEWAVDSFFDITYRIDFVGNPAGPLAGRSGSTTGTIRLANNASAPAVVCSPPSGSAFPVGTTTVTCWTTNECGFSDSCQFKVTVEADQEPPRILCPNGIVEWTCGDGAVVNYTVTATDDYDTNVTITCNPPSGSVFPAGVTVVTCVATDDCGKTDRCEFSVRVRKDTEPPRIVCPTNIVVVTCRTNARVHYAVSATDDCDTNVTVACTPPSGSLFPLGTTTVHCVATDDCGNRDECRFEVVVRTEQGPPLTIRHTATANGFLVCWPAPSPGWRLQCSPTLNVPNLWQDVTNAPVLMGSQWCVLLPNNARHRFYRLCKPCDPIITGVSHLRPREGDVLTVVGTGFGFNPDNLCIVIVERSLVTTNGPGDSVGTGLGDGVRYIPLRALSANETSMTARMGPVPPDAKPGHIMVGHGVGQTGRFRPAFFDVFLEEPVWTWNKFGPAGMGEEVVEPQPEPNPPATERCFHSGPPQNGELCVFIQGDWGTNCYISIIARAHDSTTDTGGHDLDGPTVRFLNAGTTRDCVERIVDVLRCAFQQQAGVQIEVTFEEVPPGSGVFKITVRIPGGYIDRGMLTICVRCPEQPGITSITPQTAQSGQVVRVRGTNFPTDPNDICLVAVNGNEFIPFHVLDSSGTELVARLGPVPPNAQPGPIMMGVGEGSRGRFRPAFFDIFVEDDVWTWRKRGPVAISDEPFRPVPTPPPPSNCWFFSGPPIEGKLCVFFDPDCPWPSNAIVSVVARAHDATTGAGGHDLAAPNVRFVGGGSLIECAARVADILRCAFQQQAGVTVHVEIDPLPDGRVKLTVSIPGGHIDRGMLTICVGPPSVAGGP